MMAKVSLDETCASAAKARDDLLAHILENGDAFGKCAAYRNAMARTALVFDSLAEDADADMVLVVSIMNDHDITVDQLKLAAKAYNALCGSREIRNLD